MAQNEMKTMKPCDCVFRLFLYYVAMNKPIQSSANVDVSRLPPKINGIPYDNIHDGKRKTAKYVDRKRRKEKNSEPVKHSCHCDSRINTQRNPNFDNDVSKQNSTMK